ncbi:MAG: Lrp/AsnC ligand binding domain-containing protein [Candidatus Bathyarchaeia archaeon]
MTIKAYILFKVNSGTEGDVCRKLADFDEVLDASIIYGEYDLMALVSVQEIEDLHKLLEKIRGIPSIILTSTMIIAKQYKGRNKINTLKAMEKLK